MKAGILLSKWQDNQLIIICLSICIGKKTKKQKWKPIETEVISVASGTSWADEVEKEQNGNINNFLNS